MLYVSFVNERESVRLCPAPFLILVAGGLKASDIRLEIFCSETVAHLTFAAQYLW